MKKIIALASLVAAMGLCAVAVAAPSASTNAGTPDTVSQQAGWGDMRCPVDRDPRDCPMM